VENRADDEILQLMRVFYVEKGYLAGPGFAALPGYVRNYAEVNAVASR